MQAIAHFKNKHIEITQSSEFGLWLVDKQKAYNDEVAISFKVLQEQFDEFISGEATVGDLLDIRYHI